MDKRKSLSMTLVSLIIGLMIAIQFQTVQKPVVRDTRDTWELRDDLLKEKEQQAKLLSEIRTNEEALAKYETERTQSKEQALRDTLDELKVEAGLTDVTGPGVILKIQPIEEELLLGKTTGTISPDLLKRLLNELNMYDAMHISIDGQRVVNNTVIRDINRETKVNGYSLKSLPIEIKVVTDGMQAAEKLYNRMQVSQVIEDFFIDSLRVEVLKPELEVTVPAYEGTLRIRNIKPVKPGKGGN